MATKKVVKKEVSRKPKFFDEPQDELLKEFKQFHTVKVMVGLSEINGVVIRFTKDGVIIRENGQQEHREFKTGEVQFMNDQGVQ